MVFKMRGVNLKGIVSPIKHSIPYSTGHGKERGVTEEEYKDKHPGPGTPDIRGYHTGHKGIDPIYPEEQTRKIQQLLKNPPSQILSPTGVGSGKKKSYKGKKVKK